MKISKVIEELKKVLQTEGDIDFVVDTDAAKYTCHMVEVTGIWTPPNELSDMFCYATLDNSTKDLS